MRTNQLRDLLIAGMMTVILQTACGSNGSSSSTAPQDATSLGQKFKLADNAVSGWTQDTSSTTSYSVWTAANLTNIIDGAAPAYTSRGCQFAMYQDLVGPSPELLTLVAMYFGTDTQATSMFTYEQQQTGASVAIPQYDTSVAVGYPGLTGITVYAHFKAYYFELQFDGISDQTAGAQAATPFLKLLEQKSN